VFDTIILLTAPARQTFLADLLCSHNPVVTIRPVATTADVDAIEPKVLRRSRLLAFDTPVLVPAPVLDGLGFGAYNFHPGPPHYPGWAPAHFAIYDRAESFGAPPRM
jgi:methionyl-tRNA formyltransferase